MIRAEKSRISANGSMHCMVKSLDAYIHPRHPACFALVFFYFPYGVLRLKVLLSLRIISSLIPHQFTIAHPCSAILLLPLR